ncbi:flavin reductase (DIM6/NTAB) family NADH-FMN oxidoreductase RutF [Wenyingzhuangia heitensis]|uniref:Flavin reductase (DIM6/NTAB) family NADH-FMN oxidoreductase RutF n=1 Tax=Wenyingzhuangia heitensis TaxID=1487859 RepID=A0ABX0U7C8_9FLAO|nr:flavin reductase [Wenyingzhuangia heitensis]NIJ44760.1 flavin reductase (DIM6/NTAB) family NADH-FMN oxidoreductase RutF [Wenyingzhuangia heitensis]
MKTFTKQEIAKLEHLYKINLINSVTGLKSANLVGSISNSGLVNVSVFSSIVHFGSEPPLLGMVFRPTTVARNTYDNIKENEFYSINHIHQSIIKDSHHTSAKYPFDVNEFEQTNLEEEYKTDSYIPFVKNAPVQLLMKYVGEYNIQENGTILMLGEIQKLYVQDSLIHTDGFVDLAKGNVVAINGLDGYVKTELIERLPYQRPKKQQV